VYCDGSLIAPATGCAVWSEKFNFATRLMPHTSVFTAELSAIYLALKYVEYRHGTFAIFSDSLSSLSALQSTTKTKHYLLTRIKTLLGSLPEGKVTMHWIPSHVGIVGNERADTLAKASLTYKIPTATFIPNPDLRNLVYQAQRDRWQLWWSTQKPAQKWPELLEDPPFDKNLSRREQICITRLRLHTCLLTHGHIFSGDQPPVCPSCQVQLSLAHLFLTCPLHERQRVGLRTAANRLEKPFTLPTLLEQDFPAKILITYLDQIGYRGRI
jgi:ribonuclease HI